MIPVIDMHCDTLSMIKYDSMFEGKEFELRKNDKHIDVFKLAEAGYMCQTFAVFTELEEVRKKGIAPFDFGMDILDIMDSELKKNEDMIRPIKTAADIEDNFRDGIVSALISVEEGAVYEGSIEKLKKFYERGVRKSTLTWNYENELAFPNKKNDDGSQGFDTENGLKKAGFEIVEAMQDMGIIIDISHLNDSGIKDVFSAVKKDVPVIASHSNARGVTMHPRNLSDEMIRHIAEHGGVCGINFLYDFATIRNPEEWKDKDPKDLLTTVEDLIRHMKYIKNVGGIDILALGSDFDGIDNDLEFVNAKGIQQIAEGMERSGFTVDEIEKVFYKNALRVYKTVLK